MNIQGLRAAEARLRKFEGTPGNSSLVRSCILYFRPGATASDLDQQLHAWRAANPAPAAWEADPRAVLYAAHMPHRGANGLALPDVIDADTDGGWFSRRGLMGIRQ